MQNYKKISLCAFVHKDIFHVVVISFASRLSRSSAESLKRKLPFMAALMRPVSSETTTAMASLACDMPRAARWRKPSSLGMSMLWLTGKMHPAALMRRLEMTMAPS